MAYALTLRQSCSRYLSPSRLATHNTQTSPVCHICSESNHHGTLHSPVVPWSRGAFVDPPFIHQSCCRNHILSQQQSGQQDTTVPHHITQGFKTSQSVLEESKGRGGYLDMKSVMRMIGSLNIDFPSSFKWKSLATPLSKNESNNIQETVEADLLVRNNERVTSNQDTEELSVEDSTKETSDTAKHENIIPDCIVIKTDEEVHRQQHNFAEAMSEQDISVQNFYKTHSSAGSNTVKNNAKPNPGQSTDAPPLAGALGTTSNLVKQITSYIPGFPGTKQTESPRKSTVLKSAKNKLLKNNIPRSVVDRKTRGLVKALRVATSYASKLVRLEELCRHLNSHPEAKTLAVTEKVVPCLLRLRSCKDVSLREQAREGLALVGYIDPVKSRGIRILTLDGGGTRGLVAMEILRRLEKNCKRPIHELFDYICGVSTGSLIGIMLGIHRLTIDQTENLYKIFSREIFNRYKLMGVGKLVISQGYYDAQLWEKILRENIGLQTFLESARDDKTPKLSVISTLMNMTKLSNYVFRNYTHPVGAQTLYPGSCKYTFWEAIRASSAAPMYYQEYKLDEWIHQDGGMLNNNPTGIAIHEAKLLWPSESIQCVVSLGTGRYEPSLEPEMTSTGIRNKVHKIIQSATDTEAVHTVLHDLLPPSAYYRFNPYMSEDYTLDEIRPDRWDQMRLDTQLYCRKNQYKLQKVCDQLQLTKLPHQKARNWLKLKKDELG